jgi:DNA-binding NtrC family response regulator
MTKPESRKPSLLIVDDDPLIIDTLAFFLSREFDISTAGSRADCIALLRSQGAAPQLALVDLGLPPQPHQPDEGFALISDLLAHSPAIKIVVLSGRTTKPTHATPAHWVPRSSSPSRPTRATAANPAADTGLPVGRACRPARRAEDPCGLLGNSVPMQKLRAQIKQYGDSPFPVLIEGESGSGKELVASCCLHRLTARRDKPYFALNCAAISPTLVEPTLFGYAKGAFTGAIQAKSGYFEDAEDGTLFLDEIGELPLDLQPKLLRVLENGEFQRVGETQQRVSRARVIAATNRDLRKEVREGRFRADLYHRLSVFTINVPPCAKWATTRCCCCAITAPSMPSRPAAALRTLRRSPVPLAGLRLPRQRARTAQHRHPPGHQVPGRPVGFAELEDELDTVRRNSPPPGCRRRTSTNCRRSPCASCSSAASSTLTTPCCAGSRATSRQR